MTLREAAERTDRSVTTLRRYIRNGRLRAEMREGRYDPASKPVVKQPVAGVGGLGPGARVKHPSFGVGTVEDADGEGLNRKLVVRFGPGVGLKKVLARFIDPA